VQKGSTKPYVRWRFAALLAGFVIAVLFLIIVIAHLANQNHFNG
jgi:hypothetical protein